MTFTTTSTLAAVAAAATLAACGGSDTRGAGGGGGTREDAAFEGALEFARCMRERGIDMPDPQRGANGLVRVGGGPGHGPDPGDPKAKAALDACGKHLEAGAGPAPDPARLARFQDAFTSYARCMRAEGVQVPDPEPGRPGIVFKAGDPDAPDPASAPFKAADRTCRKHLAAVDEAAGEGPR